MALRFRTEGNSISIVSKKNNNNSNSNNGSESVTTTQTLTFDDSIPVWTSPLPGRDSGMALIGKRVRCFFPKLDGHKRRVLEGEVVSLIDYGLAQRKRGRPIRVGLLVDRTVLDDFTFLKRLDHDVDATKLPNKKARRNHRMEQNIRGKQKVTVHIKLSNPVTADVTHSVQWVIQKRVPPKLFQKAAAGTVRRNSSLASPVPVATPTSVMTTTKGTVATITGETATATGNTNGATGTTAVVADAATAAATTNGKNGQKAAQPHKKRRKFNTVNDTKHVGDGNDPQEQQVTNWRWLAGRFHDLLLSSKSESVDPYGANVLSAGLVGQVLKVESSPVSSSLAVVTLLRLFLPEQTATGRLPHHGPYDIFEDYDATDAAAGGSVRVQVPVEHLIIISRRVEKNHGENEVQSSKEHAAWEQLLEVSHSYSLRKDAFSPLMQPENIAARDESNSFPQNESKDTITCCHRCRRSILKSEATSCTSKDCPLADTKLKKATIWCPSCLKVLPSVNNIHESAKPCYHEMCDCRTCRSLVASGLEQKLWTSVSTAVAVNRNVQAGSERPLLLPYLSSIGSVGLIDFELPNRFADLGSLPIPKEKPITKVFARSPKKVKKSLSPKFGNISTGSKTSEKRSATKSNGKMALVSIDDGKLEELVELKEDYSVFKPSCSRLVPYDPATTGRSLVADLVSANSDKPRNLRQTLMDRPGDGEKDEKTSSSRRARANQRRMMKGVAAIGVTSFGLDTLAARESQLRFDRSGIHAWGVFADEPIASGEMIVEYRGVLIGNTTAEKREKQYEAAKIGSDYMFRIDALQVCDATKQGNVARFLNASCGPNCYTKIITLDGNKRIVIYAKREISAGEELCYDYKFPLEYDASKRIPCYCGTKECRGWMNWVRSHILFTLQKF